MTFKLSNALNLINDVFFVEVLQGDIEIEDGYDCVSFELGGAEVKIDKYHSGIIKVLYRGKDRFSFIPRYCSTSTSLKGTLEEIRDIYRRRG